MATTIQDAIRDHLLSQAQITFATRTRIRTASRTRGETLPYLVVRHVDGNTHQHLTGASGQCTDRLEVEAVAGTDLAAEDLRSQVEQALLSIPVPATVQGVRVLGIEHAGCYGGVQLPQDNTITEEHSKSIDFLVSYTKRYP